VAGSVPEAVEAPSGKDAAYENFPVGSWLLPAALRPHIAVFYAFARAIDDIADSPTLPPQEKLDRLGLFEAALLSGAPDHAGLDKARRMRASLDATGTTPQHCLDLIAAFKQDAVKGRYKDWDDLLGYCILSAAPVGRYLLDLHGGSRHGYPASDALCMALQVINHLQDCKDDYRTLDRVYIPGDWLAETGLDVDVLAAPAAPPALRRVLDRTLDATERLLRDADPLPAGLRSRRLAMESAAIISIASKLIAKLRREDPLARRVVLSKGQYAASVLSGVFSILLGRG
jgi:squalene synthase HpnC